jgi:hypothetical protein
MDQERGDRSQSITLKVGAASPEIHYSAIRKEAAGSKRILFYSIFLANLHVENSLSRGRSSEVDSNRSLGKG